MEELLKDFIAETRETLDALAGEIVAWESDPADRARLDAIFRFVHTVKGSCGFLDLPRLARLSHAAEDVLAAARAGTRTPDKPLVDAVLAVVDRIGELVEAIDAGTSLDDSSEDLLIAALAERPADASSDAGIAVAAPAAAAARTPARSVRLSVDLLDRMMSGMSEMVLARNDLARRVRSEAGDPGVEAALERLSATVAEMRDTVTRTRMQTIEALFSPLPRLVRDTAASVGKKVALTIDGADVELDREMIELMRDPLVHMVRNAIDHGIETPAERVRAGKRETGTLSVSARQAGNRIIVEIADDGRGIDTARLMEKIARADPDRAPALRSLGERGRLDLVFEAGVTSREEVTALSGRGVGMDVVRANVEQIGGRIELHNRLGQGLAVAVEVPLTLAILSAVVVRVGDQRFAVPRPAIEEIVATGGGAVRIDRVGDARVAAIRERRLPLIGLAQLLGLDEDAAAPAMVVVVDVANGAYALGIDGIDDTEELVVKPAAPAVMAAGVFAGQTLPDSGLPLMLLDCTGMAQAAGLRFDTVAAAEEATQAAPEPGLALLLFEDRDACRRAIALSAVDRVDLVPAEDVVEAGGRLRLVAGERTVPLLACAPMGAAASVPILRLHGPRGEIGYVIAAALDIVTLTAPITPVQGGGRIAGVTVVDGRPVELLDPLWILAQAGGTVVDERPLCLLQGGEAGWMSAVLAPTLEAAGYRTATALNPGEHAAVTLAMEDDEHPSGERLVRLSREPGTGVYCLDRAALVDAVSRRVRGDAR